MANLTLIKKLREKTGCGIGDCSKALKECGDNLDKSIDWLRKKGLSSAAKKADRIAAEGVVAICIDGQKAALVEVNSETDFVAKNKTFQEFANEIAKIAVECKNVEELKSKKYSKTGNSVSDEIAAKIGTIGENINIRRISQIEGKENSVISSYIHSAVADNLGKIAVITVINSNGDKDKVNDLGKKIAMHIAATKPEALSIETLDPAKLEREKEVLREQSRASGKPEDIIEKMIEGRIRKFYEEVILLEQFFVMEDKVKVKDIIARFAKENNCDVKLVDYAIFVLGEGVEKKSENFAEEVAKITG